MQACEYLEHVEDKDKKQKHQLACLKEIPRTINRLLVLYIFKSCLDRM